MAIRWNGNRLWMYGNVRLFAYICSFICIYSHFLVAFIYIGLLWGILCSDPSNRTTTTCSHSVTLPVSYGGGWVRLCGENKNFHHPELFEELFENEFNENKMEANFFWCLSLNSVCLAAFQIWFGLLCSLFNSELIWGPCFSKTTLNALSAIISFWVRQCDASFGHFALWRFICWLSRFQY